MIFLSAQPDSLYFIWQLKLQLFNFKKNNICKECIHVLIGYSKFAGLSQCANEFINSHKDIALFFTYEDTRDRNQYPSSIRPHIIYKHFSKYPFLEKEVLFYHDSDVILKEGFTWKCLLHNKNWYASATPYISFHCIIKTIGVNAFETMCNIIGVNKELVAKNDKNVCGAQYILKQTTASFWKKVEVDCEKIYSYLLAQTCNCYPFTNNTTLPEFQIWCTDMVVIWWNTLKLNNALRPSEKLKFCWVDSHIKEWEKCDILHYTGKMNTKGSVEKYFCKTDYVYHEPFYDNFNYLDKTTCSSIIVDFIKEYWCELKKNRIDLSDTLFIVLLNDSNKQSVSQALSSVKYIYKYFSTNIHLIESGNVPYVDRKTLYEEFGYSFVEKSNYSLHARKQLMEEIIDNASVLHVAIWDSNIIVPVEQIETCVTLLRSNAYSAIIPYNKPIANIDVLTSQIFQKIVDDRILLENLGKADVRNFQKNNITCLFKKEGYKKNFPLLIDNTASQNNLSPNQIKTCVPSINGFIFELFLTKKI